VARKALELDPELAEARVLLANALQKDWHWAEAEVEYRRAIELSPNDAAAQAGLADWLLCQGRTDEALASARRAQELDPRAFDGVASRLESSFRLGATTRPFGNCTLH